MESVKYLHAADLHLDAAAKGSVCHFSEDSAKIVAEATFTALDRLVRVAKSEKPDFVVLAGDIYNEEDYSLKAQLALRDACKSLNESAIPVFVACGNHDPASSRRMALEWPDNVIFFGENAESFPIYKNDKNDRPFALVHGISHIHSDEGRNLAKLFRRDENASCFQLGVLHCSIGNGPKDRYAPCSLEDLIKSGMDAWALGHAHIRQIVSEKPFIAYSGNTQGLHINESGPKGCYLVTATPRDGGYECSAKFCQLGPAQWETLELDVSCAATLDEIERKVEKGLADLSESLPPECATLFARLSLSGVTDLDALLRRPETLEAIEERLRYFANRTPSVRIRDFSLATRGAPQTENLLARDDLAGEMARICEKIVSSSESLEEFAKKTLAPLFDNPRLRGLLNIPQGEELLALFADAKRTGLEKLEKS